jgi:hypothetical protein
MPDQGGLEAAVIAHSPCRFEEVSHSPLSPADHEDIIFEPPAYAGVAMSTDSAPYLPIAMRRR